MIREQIVYSGADMPDVEARVNEHWCAGELRMQTQDNEGAWSMNVQYRPPGETSSYVGAFAEDQVRRDSVDRSAGRPAR